MEFIRIMQVGIKELNLMTFQFDKNKSVCNDSTKSLNQYITVYNLQLFHFVFVLKGYFSVNFHNMNPN